MVVSVDGFAENATPPVIGIAYDPPGRRSFVNRLNPWDSLYEYDPASRLTALTNSRYGSPDDVRFGVTVTVTEFQGITLTVH